jgi:hypothetical protein
MCAIRKVFLHIAIAVCQAQVARRDEFIELSAVKRWRVDYHGDGLRAVTSGA